MLGSLCESFATVETRFECIARHVEIARNSANIWFFLATGDCDRLLKGFLWKFRYIEMVVVDSGWIEELTLVKSAFELNGLLKWKPQQPEGVGWLAEPGYSYEGDRRARTGRYSHNAPPCTRCGVLRYIGSSWKPCGFQGYYIGQSYHNVWLAPHMSSVTTWRLDPNLREKGIPKKDSY